MHHRATSHADTARCVFYCEYLPRDRRWKWTWTASSQGSGEAFAERVFSSLNDCLQDAALQGYNDSHISIRYSAREPRLSFLERLDDRSREFIRALRDLIPAGKPKTHPGHASNELVWQVPSPAETKAWTFAGSARRGPGELPAGD